MLAASAVCGGMCAAATSCPAVCLCCFRCWSVCPRASAGLGPFQRLGHRVLASELLSARSVLPPPPPGFGGRALRPGLNVRGLPVGLLVLVSPSSQPGLRSGLIPLVVPRLSLGRMESPILMLRFLRFNPFPRF